jgi:hypothetical protein
VQKCSDPEKETINRRHLIGVALQNQCPEETQLSPCQGKPTKQTVGALNKKVFILYHVGLYRDVILP